MAQTIDFIEEEEEGAVCGLRGLEGGCSTEAASRVAFAGWGGLYRPPAFPLSRWGGREGRARGEGSGYGIVKLNALVRNTANCARLTVSDGQ